MSSLNQKGLLAIELPLKRVFNVYCMWWPRVCVCVWFFFCLLILKHKRGMYKSLLKNINNKQYYDSLTSSYYSKLIFSISFKCITNNLFTTIAFLLVGMNDQCYKHNQKSAIFDIWHRANTRPLKLNWIWRCYNCC